MIENSQFIGDDGCWGCECPANVSDKDDMCANCILNDNDLDDFEEE